MSNEGVFHSLNDRNFLKCEHCGKYKVDTNEEFHIIYREDKRRSWLCDECYKFYPIFKGSSILLRLIIAPGKDDDEFKVYKREMYIEDGEG